MEFERYRPLYLSVDFVLVTRTNLHEVVTEFGDGVIYRSSPEQSAKVPAYFGVIMCWNGPQMVSPGLYVGRRPDGTKIVISQTQLHEQYEAVR